MRYEVSKTVWPFMLSIGLAYFVTLCLFPGIESEVISCKIGSWMPIILMGVFNLFDFIGKVSCVLRIVGMRLQCDLSVIFCVTNSTKCSIGK